MKRLRRILLLILLAGITGSVTWWFVRPKPTDRQQIEDLIERARSAVEARRPGPVLAAISEAYQDRVGYTRRDLALMVAGLSRQRVQVKVAISDYRLNIQGRRATADLSLDVDVSDPNSAANHYTGNVQIEFRKERRGWKAISSSGWQDWAAMSM